MTNGTTGSGERIEATRELERVKLDFIEFFIKEAGFSSNASKIGLLSPENSSESYDDIENKVKALISIKLSLWVEMYRNKVDLREISKDIGIELEKINVALSVYFESKNKTGDSWLKDKFCEIAEDPSGVINLDYERKLSETLDSIRQRAVAGCSNMELDGALAVDIIARLHDLNVGCSNLSDSIVSDSVVSDGLFRSVIDPRYGYDDDKLLVNQIKEYKAFRDNFLAGEKLLDFSNKFEGDCNRFKRFSQLESLVPDHEDISQMSESNKKKLASLLPISQHKRVIRHILSFQSYLHADHENLEILNTEVIKKACLLRFRLIDLKESVVDILTNRLLDEKCKDGSSPGAELKNQARNFIFSKIQGVELSESGFDELFINADKIEAKEDEDRASDQLQLLDANSYLGVIQQFDVIIQNFDPLAVDVGDDNSSFSGEQDRVIESVFSDMIKFLDGNDVNAMCSNNEHLNAQRKEIFARIIDIITCIPKLFQIFACMMRGQHCNIRVRGETFVTTGAALQALYGGDHLALKLADIQNIIQDNLKGKGVDDSSCVFWRHSAADGAAVAAAGQVVVAA